MIWSFASSEFVLASSLRILLSVLFQGTETGETWPAMYYSLLTFASSSLCDSGGGRGGVFGVPHVLLGGPVTAPQFSLGMAGRLLVGVGAQRHSCMVQVGCW